MDTHTPMDKIKKFIWLICGRRRKENSHLVKARTETCVKISTKRSEKIKVVRGKLTAGVKMKHAPLPVPLSFIDVGEQVPE